MKQLPSNRSNDEMDEGVLHIHIYITWTIQSSTYECTYVGYASDGEHDNYCDKRHAVACRLNT